MKQLSRGLQSRTDTSRRTFIQVASLGSAASLLMATRSKARAAATTDALLLICMDYRLMDDIERDMSGRGLRDKYNHIVLAGASLGAVTDKYPAWNQTFWEHLGTALSGRESVIPAFMTSCATPVDYLDLYNECRFAKE